MVSPITDPKLIAQLNAQASDAPKAVTDPELIRRLEGESQKGFAGIGEDISKSVSGLPDAVIEMISSIPGGIEKAARYATTENPLKTLANLAAGAVEGGVGLASAPQETLHYLANKFPGLSKKIQGSDAGFGQGAKDQTLYEALKEFEKKHGLLPKSEDEAAVRSGGELLSGGKLLSKLKSALGRAGTIGAAQAGQGGDPLQAALMGLAGEGALKGASKASDLRPSRMFSSKLSAEDLQKAADVTRGTETDLGSVIQNPMLKQQYENVIAKIPGSGAYDAMDRTSNIIHDKGADILKGIMGDEKIEDTGSELLEGLKDAHKDIKAEKKSRFKVTDDIAEKNGVRTNRRNLRAAAQNVLQQISSDPDLAYIRNDADLGAIKKIAEGGEEEHSIKNTEFVKSALREEAHDASSSASPNTNKARIYGSLAEAAEKDINEAIDNSGNDDLKKSRRDNLDWYRDNYAAFEDPNIAKFLRRGGDSDTIAGHFLKTSRLGDRANLLEKLQNKLPQSKKNLLPYSYFSQAFDEGRLNPLKLRTLYKKLGDRQRKALIPEDSIQKMDNYVKLVDKNVEPLTSMFNPKTGQRQTSALPYMLSTIAGALGTTLTGGMPTGLLAAGIPPIAAKLLTKYLTSGTVRERLINKMIDDKIKGSPRVDMSKMAPIVDQILANQQNNQERQ